MKFLFSSMFPRHADNRKPFRLSWQGVPLYDSTYRYIFDRHRTQLNGAETVRSQCYQSANLTSIFT